MNAPERRQYTRQPISLSALVHPAEGRSWLCAVKDFCETGLLLMSARSGMPLSSSHPHLSAGDDVSVHFSVATSSGQQHFRSSARIARVTETGMGVFFADGLPDGAFDAMVDYGIAAGMLSPAAMGREVEEIELQELQPPSLKSQVGETAMEGMRDERIDQTQADFVRRRVRRVIERFSARLGAQFSERAEQTLLLKARDAGTNAVQMMYFEGLDALEKHRDGIAASLAKELLDQIDEVADLERVLEQRRRRETSSSGKLELAGGC